MSNIQVFDNPEFGAVRTLEENGTILFCATDAAKALGYATPRKAFVDWLLAKKYLYRDQKGKLLPREDKNNGLFEVKEAKNEKTQWSGVQTLVTPKGRETFRLLYL